MPCFVLRLSKHLPFSFTSVFHVVRFDGRITMQRNENAKCWPAVVLLGLIAYGPSMVRAQDIIHVDTDATGSVHNGQTWCTAYVDLQDALTAAGAGDEIRVADGVYTPDRGTGNRGATFQLRNGVTINGGYAGCGAADPDERDIAIHEAVLSGDLAHNDGPGFTNNGDNSYHVVTGSGTFSIAVVDGFTIMAGHANAGGSNNRGAGLYSDHGSPTIANCTFLRNAATNSGGAMYSTGGGPRLMNCTFRANTAPFGGAMSNTNTDSSQFVACRFIANTANFGGGIMNASSTLSLTNCRFVGNSAAVTGGGFDNPVGSPTLINCEFIGNSAPAGGGMRDYVGSPKLTNCTMVANTATTGGGMYFAQYGNARISNCIFWGNTDSSGSTESAQLHVFSGPPLLNYSTVQGWTGSLGGTGNIGDDPLFVDADGADGIPGNQDDDLRLTAESPAIDAGDNEALAPSITTDLDGHPRFVDVLATADTGNGVTAIVDMGVYEYYDCNGNGIQDDEDIAAGTSTDCSGDGVPDECEPDCNATGVPDPCDILTGFSEDCDGDGVPDECQRDCDNDETPDVCELPPFGGGADCNRNDIPDSCDLADGTSADCDENGIPDECESDCNGNFVLDQCDIADGTSTDCDGNGVPDECDYFCDNDPCDPADAALIPVSASGPHAIVGNEILLDGSGQRVFLEIQLSGWDRDRDGAPELYEYSVTIDSSGYASGLSGELEPAQESCASDAECEAAFGEGATCSQPSTSGVNCTAGFIDTNRPDFVFPNGFGYVDLGTPDYRYGASSSCQTDPGIVQYGGTLVVDVPLGAQGTFTIGFDSPSGFMFECALKCFIPLRHTPVLITIVDCPEVLAPIVSGYGSRYLAVRPQAAATPVPVALHVASPDWPCLRKYVGAAGKLVDAPLLRLPDDWGTVMVHDRDIVPSSTYEVRAESSTCLGPAGWGVTALWGDTTGDFYAHAWKVPDGEVNISDAVAVLDKFKQLPSAPPIEWVDLFPNITDGSIDITDAVMVIDAFRGLPYPFDAPCE